MLCCRDNESYPGSSPSTDQTACAKVCDDRLMCMTEGMQGVAKRRKCSARRSRLPGRRRRGEEPGEQVLWQGAPHVYHFFGGRWHGWAGGGRGRRHAAIVDGLLD